MEPPAPPDGATEAPLEPGAAPLELPPPRAQLAEPEEPDELGDWRSVSPSSDDDWLALWIPLELDVWPPPPPLPPMPPPPPAEPEPEPPLGDPSAWRRASQVNEAMQRIWPFSLMLALAVSC